MVKRKANREIYVNETSIVLHDVSSYTSKYVEGGKQGRKNKTVGLYHRSA